MIKAILFDMDGVLYDSMPSHVRAWQETMALHGVKEKQERFYLFEGRTGASTINVLFEETFGREATEEEKQSIYAEKARRFVELEGDTSRPMPGALEALRKVKALGLTRVIVTGSGQQSLFEKIHNDYPGFFDKDLMVTAYDVKYGKPHPEPYLMGLQKAGIHAHEAIVVENAPLGVEAGKAAGIYTVAVNTGPLDNQVLLDSGADLLFPSMTAFAASVETLVMMERG